MPILALFDIEFAGLIVFAVLVVDVVFVVVVFVTVVPFAIVLVTELVVFTEFVLLVVLLAALSPQAIPKTPITRTDERAITFFIPFDSPVFFKD